MKIKEIINIIGFQKTTYFGEDEIKDIVFDSRKIKKGDLFFALSGKNKEMLYIEEAIKKGAVCVIGEEEIAGVPFVVVDNARRYLAKFCAEYYGHPEEKVKIVCVTGTNGKTTTTHMIAGIYRSLGKKVAVIGTLGLFLEGEYEYFGLTTPDTPDFFEMLDRCVKKDVDVVVIEYSAHAIYYEKLFGVPFAIGCFTNLSVDHLDFFDDMETYGKVKKSLFLSNDVTVAVINSDDVTGREILVERKSKSVSIATDNSVILNKKADLYAEKYDFVKMSFTLVYKGEKYIVHTPFFGEYNVNNMTLAMGALIADGYSITETIDAVADLPSVRGRFDVVYNEENKIIIDFAHTPDALKKVLLSARDLTGNRLLCVFGCGGDRDKTKRPTMGKIATELCDLSIITSDNPRYERPKDIIADIESGVVGKKYVTVSDRQEAIRYAVNVLTPGDVLVVAGKGAEDYLEIRGKRYCYSDYEAVKKAIKMKKSHHI